MNQAIRSCKPSATGGGLPWHPQWGPTQKSYFLQVSLSRRDRPLLPEPRLTSIDLLIPGVTHGGGVTLIPPRASAALGDYGERAASSPRKQGGGVGEGSPSGEFPLWRILGFEYPPPILLRKQRGPSKIQFHQLGSKAPLSSCSIKPMDRGAEGRLHPKGLLPAPQSSPRKGRLYKQSPKQPPSPPLDPLSWLYFGRKLGGPSSPQWPPHMDPLAPQHAAPFLPQSLHTSPSCPQIKKHFPPWLSPCLCPNVISSQIPP